MSTYQSWYDMMRRCYDNQQKDFPNYGGRGIEVCSRWHSFSSFKADMGERPEGLVLDRKDPNGNYEPNNCRWATRAEGVRRTKPEKPSYREAALEAIRNAFTVK